MKFTQLSLVAALAVSSAFAGGDIAPVAPAVPAPVTTDCNKATTIAGKLTAYYITNDASDTNDMFSQEASQLALAATLDVAHKVNDFVTLNFSAIGYLNTLKQENLMYMEGDKRGAIFNVANATFTYEDTTFVAGRQLLDTPMLGSFDWLLAPSSFEAYTLVNSSIENVTLVGSYVAKWRQNNTGDNFLNLADNGDNYAFGAVYDDKTLNASVWYYNVDAASYTQVYVDAGYNFGMAKVDAQYVATDYDAGEDATAYGVKVSGSVSGFDVYAAYNAIQDNATGYVGVDSLYTSSWNTFASSTYNEDVDAFKVGASTTISGVAAELSYADYDQGNEFDLILGYDITSTVDAGLVFTSTTANEDDADAVNALEIYANYKF